MSNITENLDNKEVAKRIIDKQLITLYKDQSILMKSLQMGLSKERLVPVPKKILYKHYIIYIDYASVVLGTSIRRFDLDEYWEVMKEYADRKKFTVTDEDIIIY